MTILNSKTMKGSKQNSNNSYHKVQLRAAVAGSPLRDRRSADSLGSQVRDAEAHCQTIQARARGAHPTQDYSDSDLRKIRKINEDLKGDVISMTLSAGARSKARGSSQERSGKESKHVKSTIEQAMSPETAGQADKQDPMKMPEYALMTHGEYRGFDLRSSVEINDSVKGATIKTATLRRGSSPQRKQNSSGMRYSRQSPNRASPGGLQASSDFSYKKMRIGDVKDESMRLRNISAQRRKPPSPTKPLCSNSQYSLNPQNTQKLWNDFERSLAPQLSSQHQRNAPVMLSQQQALRANFKTAQIQSPKTKRWSPSGRKDARQRAVDRNSSALNLFQQGIDDAVANYGRNGGSPLRQWSSSAGRPKKGKKSRARNAASKTTQSTNYHGTFMFGQTVKEMERNFKEDLNQRAIGRTQQDTTDLNEYLGNTNLRYDNAGGLPAGSSRQNGTSSGTLFVDQEPERISHEPDFKFLSSQSRDAILPIADSRHSIEEMNGGGVKSILRQRFTRARPAEPLEEGQPLSSPPDIESEPSRGHLLQEGRQTTSRSNRQITYWVPQSFGASAIQSKQVSRGNLIAIPDQIPETHRTSPKELVHDEFNLVASHGQGRNMFNMTVTGMESEDRHSNQPQHAYSSVNQSMPLRKKSPAELVDTINRKYSRLFGGQDLVAFHASNKAGNQFNLPDTSGMETEDFMDFLRHPRSFSVQPKHRPVSQSPQRLRKRNVMFHSSSLRRRTLSPSNSHDRLRRQVNYSQGRNEERKLLAQKRVLRHRSLSMAKNMKRGGKMITSKGETCTINLKVGSFKSMLDMQRFNNYRTRHMHRPKMLLRSASESKNRMTTAPDSGRSHSARRGSRPTMQRALSQVAPTRRLLPVQGQTKKPIGLKGMNRFTENEWDRRELSRQRYEEWKKHKQMKKERKDPWALPRPKSQTQVQDDEDVSQPVVTDYQKVIVEIWKDLRRMTRRLPQQSTEEKQALMQLARVKAILCRLQPYVFAKYTEYYKIYKLHESHSDVGKRVAALLLNEKILRKVDFEVIKYSAGAIRLRMLNAFMLVKSYAQQNDFERTVRYLTEPTEANLFLPSLLLRLSRVPNLSDISLQDYVLFLYQMLGNAQMKMGQWKEAKETFYLLCKVYNRWKVNNADMQAVNAAEEEDDPVSAPTPVEFGVDDYIGAKASYAEAIMNCGELDLAIEKFENVKRNIETEIVYENPLLFVNVCNQLANCHLLKGRTDRALALFQQSLVLINKIEGERASDAGIGSSIETEGKACEFEQISPHVVSKICLNIALIRTQLGQVQEAVFMHEKSLAYKSSVTPQLNDDVRDQNLLLAFAYQRAGEHGKACATLERALMIHKSTNGEQNAKTSQILMHIGQAYQKVDNREEALNAYEYAAMLLLQLEREDQEGKITQKLDKAYLALINLYLESSNFKKVRELLNLIELRLDSLSAKDSYAYRMMNELANTLLKHNMRDDALSFYRKSLICMKRRYKNQFGSRSETAKILVNMAQVLEDIGNYGEAITSYQQAMEVWSRANSRHSYQEMAKIAMRLALINLRIYRDEMGAKESFIQVVKLLEAHVQEVGGWSEAPEEVKTLILEARHQLKQI